MTCKRACSASLGYRCAGEKRLGWNACTQSDAFLLGLTRQKTSMAVRLELLPSVIVTDAVSRRTPFGGLFQGWGIETSCPFFKLRFCLPVSLGLGLLGLMTWT